jgi:hypothetical protein
MGRPEVEVFMTGEELLRSCFASLEVNERFTEASLIMRDNSRLCFCHQIDQRWVKAPQGGEAGQVLPLISRFRLNARHLEVQFQDGSRWEARFSG